MLVVAFALIKETKHIVNKDVLDALGEDGIVARGGNVDVPELVRALKEGRIAGAGLDIFENEPEVPAELSVLTSESRSDLRGHTIATLKPSLQT